MVIKPHTLKIFYRIFVVIFIILTSCNKEAVEIIEPNFEGTEITSFSFLKANNPNLSEDLFLDIGVNKFTGHVRPFGVIKNLVATFEHTGSEVVINNSKQISGTTFNNFTDIITYTVKTSDGRSEDYEVDLMNFTGLPMVHINTRGESINSKEEYVSGYVSIDGAHQFENLIETDMLIRGRGNSTWYMHPKKPYQLKFEEQTAILGMPADRKWIFLADYSDKSMIRNKVTYEMGYMSKLDWTPKGVFSEVFVNYVYNGTYTIAQKVEESNQRVAIGDTGYLLEIDQLDRLDPDDVYFRTTNFLINIKEPELTYESSEYLYVKGLLNEFENVLYGSQFKDPLNGYAKYIDMDSFIDWYLINEITKNQDSKRYSSIFINVIPGGKIKMGPLWDFDLAFGNVDYSECEFPTGFWVKRHAWYSRLFEDQAFVAKVKERFVYFRQNQNFILGKMDDFASQLKWSQEENDAKWNLFGNHVWPNPIVYDTYDEEVEHLKSWYTARMNWLETAFNDL